MPVLSTVLRYTSITSVVLFWISGPILIGLGTYFAVNPTVDALQKLLTPGDVTLVRLSQVTVIIGAIILLVGAIGLFGSLKTMRIALGIYMVCLFFILLAEFAVIIFTISRKESMSFQINHDFINSIKTEYPIPPKVNEFQKALDEAQYETWGCCGVNGPKDYLETNWYKDFGSKHSPRLETPASCCIADKYPGIVLNGSISDQYSDCQKSQSVYATGCLKKTKDWIGSQLPAIIGTLSVMTLLGVFSLLVTNFYCINMGKEYQSID